MDSGTPLDVDGGYAWVVMLANFGAMVVNGGLSFSSGIIVTTLQDRFGGQIARTALAGSFFTALASLAGPIGSLVVTRTSCRIAVMVSGIIMTTGLAITAFSTNLTLIIISYGVIMGIGTGMCYAALYVVNGYHFRNKLNFATGISMSGGGVGLFALPPLLEKSKEIHGFQGLMLFAAGCSLQLVLFGCLLRPSVLEININRKSRRKNNVGSKQENGSDVKMYLDVVSDRASLCLLLCFGCYSGGLYTGYMFWPSLCQAEGFTGMEASLFLSVSGIAAIIGRLLIGAVTSHALVDVFNVYCLSLTASGVSFVLLRLYSPSAIGQIANGIILGAFGGAPLVVFPAITTKCVGLKYLSATGGLQLLFGGLGSIVMPILCGYFVSNGGSYGDVLSLCGGCLLAGAIFVLITKFTDKRLFEESSVILTKESELFVEKDSK